MTQTTYPGTLHQQRVLREIVKYYKNDARILAIGLFGSLSRGDWDEFSDLDLDIIVADHAKIDIMAELTALCSSFTTIDEAALLIVPDGLEAGDVVLTSLLEFSIRYHPLATTKWQIVDDLRVLNGHLDRAVVVAAGNRNCPSETRSLCEIAMLSSVVDRYLRYALGLSVALKRNRMWLSIELLHRMRNLLMQLYTDAHGYARVPHDFQSHATQSLQRSLAALLPQTELKSIRLCLLHGLDLLEKELSAFCEGKIELNDAQINLIRKIREHLSAQIGDDSLTYLD